MGGWLPRYLSCFSSRKAFSNPPSTTFMARMKSSRSASLGLFRPRWVGGWVGDRSVEEKQAARMR